MIELLVTDGLEEGGIIIFRFASDGEPPGLQWIVPYSCHSEVLGEAQQVIEKQNKQKLKGRT